MFLVTILLSSFILTTSGTSDKELWNQFKITHGKFYRSSLEEQLRFKKFQENLRRIEEHNERYEEGKVSYKLEINKFADVSQEEVAADLSRSSSYKALGTNLAFSRLPDAEVPEKIDWRESGVVSKVKDQGSCDGSFYFAALGVIESYYYMSNGSMVDLSEQYLIDCSQGHNNGCNGGGVLNSLDFVKNRGIESEVDYPYKGRVENCHADDDKILLRTVGVVLIPRRADDVKAVIGTMGPVAVTFDGTNLHLYSNGVYNDSSCNKNRSNQSGIVVGYGATNGGQEYWIVKLSWGSDWGENGYVRIARNAEDLCGVTNTAVYPIL